MEIAYRVFAPVFSSTVVWPVYRLPRVEGANLVVAGNEVVAIVQCDGDDCRVASIQSQPMKDLPWLRAKVYGDYYGEGNEALLIFEPFPKAISPLLFFQLRHQAHSTKVLRGIYTEDSDRHLVFRKFVELRELKRDPVRIK
jgi:hypothetical protein